MEFFLRLRFQYRTTARMLLAVLHRLTFVGKSEISKQSSADRQKY
jgi:hypothetical protein